MGAFASILRRHGVTSVISTADGQREVPSFIEPIISSPERNGWTDVTRLGERNASRWYWFGPPESDITDPENTVITVGGVSYDVLKAEPYVVNRKTSHWEAVLRIREDDYDGGA